MQTGTLAEASRIEILELDVASKSLRRTGGLDGTAGGLFLIVTDRTGDRIVTIAYRDKAARLCDGRTGAERARLAPGAADVSRWPGFLADGRIVLSEKSAATTRLLVFRPDGTPEGVVALPAGRFATLGGETAPGRLVVAVGDGSRYASHLVDLDSGTVRLLAEDLYPAARLSGPPWELNAAPEVASEATRLFVRDGKELVRLDPETGARRVLLAVRSGWPGE